MKDRGPVPGQRRDRFIGQEAGRGCRSRLQEGCERDPLIVAAGARRGRRRGGPRNAARASRTRARPGTLGTGLAPFFPRNRRRGAGDQVIEPVELERSVGLRTDQVVATSPCDSGRAEAVDQEQHDCTHSPPHQPLETDGPDQDHNLEVDELSISVRGGHSRYLQP